MDRTIDNGWVGLFRSQRGSIYGSGARIEQWHIPSWPLGFAFASENPERASEIVVTDEILAVDLTAFDMYENKLSTIPAPWGISNLADAQENSRIFLITSK